MPEHSDVIMKNMEGKPETQRGEVRIYGSCAHGFCVRADPLSGDVTKQAEEAEDQAIAWFDSQLGFRKST